MEQDEIVEQFTAWLSDQEREQLEIGNEKFTGTEIGCMSRAWNAAWKASRAAVVVGLPQPFEGDDFTMYDGDELRAAIEAAGIRTK